jgi:phosphoribosyl-ATP pyrophosphohydrolase
MTDSLDRLYRAVLAAERADPATSRTSRLMRAGRAKMAKKLGEEAIEVVIDAIAGNRDAVVRESADLLYNLAVVWASAGVEPREVWQEMDRRERMFGIAEKLQKPQAAARARAKSPPKARRKVASVRTQRSVSKRG